MIRTVITPQKQNISIHVPKSFLGKQVEVIAFTIDDKTDEKKITDFAVSEESLAKDWLSEEDSRWDNLL